MSEAQEVVCAVLRSQDEMLVLVAVGILLVGIWFGYVLRRWSWIPRNEARREYAKGALIRQAAPDTFPPLRRGKAYEDDAPVPMTPPRDSRRGETVVICGYEWTRMN